MPIEGSLEQFSLPEILQRVSMEKRTGILTVQGEDDIIAVSFREGEVVAADALNQTVEEGLGQVLASEGLVSPRDFARIQAEHEAGGSQRVLDLLFERGLLDRERLLEALRAQTYRLLVQLLRWEQGDFKFYVGEEVAYEDGFRAISVEELLVRSVAELGGGYRGGEALLGLGIAYERLPGGAPVRILGEHGEGPTEDPAAVWLAPEERAVLERLDGSTSGEEIVQETGLGEYQVLFALHRLVRAGAARPVSPPAVELKPPQFDLPAPSPARRQEPPPAAGRGVLLPSVESWRAPSPPPPPEEHGLHDPLPSEREERRPARQRLASSIGVWVRGSIGIAAIALLVVGALRPWAPLLPLPWQEEVRQGLERNQRAALYQQIDRATRSYFLLEGHYPDELAELVHLGLLAPGSLEDPRRRPLAYATDEMSYELFPVEGGLALSEMASRESITGDFLLDPEFFRFPEVSERPPLVLLD